MPKIKAKIRAVQASKSGRRLNLPNDIKWESGDVIQYHIVDENTVHMRRIVRANEEEEF